MCLHILSEAVQDHLFTDNLNLQDYRVFHNALWDYKNLL